jgi:hypothetical protein
MVFAAPYLDSLVIVYKSQSSNNLHHSTAIALPAAHDGANTTPYLAGPPGQFLMAAYRSPTKTVGGLLARSFFFSLFRSS